MSGVRERLSIGDKLIHLALGADARSIRQYEEVKGRIARDLNNIKLSDAILIREHRLACERVNRESEPLRVAVNDLPAWYRLWLQWCGEKPLDASDDLIGLRSATRREHAEECISNVKQWLRL
jgi:hypothetical protein